MLAKIVFVLCLTTAAFAFSKDEHEQHELINSVLGSVTNVGKEFSKLVSDDPDKYSVDLNSLYKKYELASKAEQAKSFLQSQFKRGAEYTNEYLKKFDEESEDQFKKSVDLIKSNDPVLGEKLNKFYEKSCEVDRLVEDIVKYVLDPEKISTSIDKVRSSLHPLEHKLIEAVKKIETLIIEHLPSKKKGKN
ncbi:uncharacterized protein LOC126838067 [Adelges cooleyi]|uniref:uncharacterized protein LOC126838067 n=1 Tax=Adelges cooleyi TaxID=133065 RepID=UPI00217F6C02|nr:uncharacterized protein LOC126838067 [Adelges cooleyi]